MAAARSATLFDRWSATYDSPGFQRATYRPIHDAVLDRVEELEPETVLDLGCGTGQLTRRLVDRFPDALVVGVDYSAGMLAGAADRSGEAGATAFPLMHADAQRLPLAPGSVDLVTCTESFHWYPDQGRALEGVADLLRDGGRLVIASIATYTTLGERAVRRATSFGSSPVRALPPHRLRSLLGRAGFEVLHQRRVPRLGTIGWPVLTDARLRG